MGSAGKGASWRRLYARRLPGPCGLIDQEWIAPIRGRREPAAISEVKIAFIIAQKEIM